MARLSVDCGSSLCVEGVVGYEMSVTLGGSIH